MIDPPFVGREGERSFLEELWRSDRPELFVLFGRRRVGKTELLQQFCRGRRAVYFLAAQVRDRDNLRAFRDALVEGLGDAAAANVEFPDWTAALSYACEQSKGERLAIVLDEFPYLCEGDKSLPSQLQRFWDTRGKRSTLLLVLCGSQVSFMEREVLAERSPLFGRRTAQKRLQPLGPSEAFPFFPNWSVADRVLAYGILGGMPAYLRRFDDRLSVRENVLRDLLRPEGYLFDEVQFLLRNELSSPTTYNSILAAVARGADRLNDIALRVGVDSPTANKYLSVLRELELVEREVPVTAPDPLRSRRGRYRIADRFIAFHFRHLQPNLSLIHAGRGARVLEQFVEPDFPRLFDEARVEFVVEHLRRQAGELVGDEILEVGRFHGTFVRAAGRTAGGGVVAGIVVPEDGDESELRTELEQLEKRFEVQPVKLVYGIGHRPDRPLEVERVPDGELL